MSERVIATDIAVEAHALVKVFGNKRAVDEIELLVPRGTIHGILGAAGAGKTTVIDMLTTSLRPDAGTARVLGHDIEKEPQSVRRLIGATEASAPVDMASTTTENLVVFARVFGFARRAAHSRALQILRWFGLADAAGMSLEKLTNGMRQRFDLAASVLVDAQPPLVLLDEPTAGLDTSGRSEMWDTLGSLAISGSTVLFSTQHMAEAVQLADRITVLDDGRVIAEGAPRQLSSAG